MECCYSEIVYSHKSDEYADCVDTQKSVHERAVFKN